jgi:drug/metabolite transporter (DMT)-like permease
MKNNEYKATMAMMITAMLMLPGLDAIAKWLSGSVSSGQVTWNRFFFQIILMSPLLLRTRGPWLTPVLFLHGARGFLIATIGHLLVVHAFRRAPVSVLAPFQYVEIIGATILGLLIFDDFPDAITWVGVVIIVGSGIYVFHRESRLSQGSGH